MVAGGSGMNEMLLVEDSDDDAEHIKRLLEQAHVSNPLVRLSDGKQALRYLGLIDEAFESAAPPVPAVLLLDLKLPGPDGFDVLERIKLRGGFQKTLRVVLSGIDDTAIIRKAYAFGAHSFLTKPIHAQDLQELIRTYPEYWLIG